MQAKYIWLLWAIHYVPDAARRTPCCEATATHWRHVFCCWPHARIAIESTQHGRTHQTVLLEVYDEQHIRADGADSDGIRIIV